MANWDDTMDKAFGKRQSNYTVKEIDEARKRQKKHGGTLMENLEQVTGQKAATLDTMQKQDSPTVRLQDSLEDQIKELDKVNREISQLTASLQEDLQEKQRRSKQLENNLSAITASPTAAVPPQQEAPKKEVKLEDFDGVEEIVAEKVHGQSAFIKRLTIAFKRPFVMPVEEGFARNCMFLTGPEDTGKHMALFTLAEEFKKRGILSNGDVRVMDLSIYSAPGQEKIFLQDLYASLKSRSDILLFENFNLCHTSYLSNIRSLVMTGKCSLSERYVLQQGQLVNMPNALTSETVGALYAGGKYLVFISTKPVEKLADSLGTPFVNALGDICQTTVLDEDSLEKVAQRELDELKRMAKQQLSFQLQYHEDAMIACGVKRAGKKAELTGIMEFYHMLFKSLAQLRLEGSYQKEEEITLEVEEETVVAVVKDERIDLLKNIPGGYQGAVDAVKKEMASIVGLKDVKEYIFSLEEYFGIQKLRREQGLKASDVNKHMIFTGNPGTGKTTIARIISRYLKAIGVLTGGQLVEVSRADLVGRYVGHTAPLTNQVISSAIGGVLFIDEAYSLYRGKEDSFGLEAIDTLVKGIEDNRDNLIVILAGYSKEMEEFLEANSGLKSRFPNIIHFPDYSGEELLAIAEITAGSKGYVIDEGAKPSLLAYFNMVQATRAMDAGNGRLVRNKIEEAILNHSRRLVAEKDADLSLLTSKDFVLED